MSDSAVRASSTSEMQSSAVEQLEEQARRLAALLAVPSRQRADGTHHLRQLSNDMRVLRDVYASLTDDTRLGETMSPAAEWMLDNFHVLTASALDVRHDLPPAYYRRLPRATAREFSGEPRVSVMASELIRRSGGRLDGQRLQRYVAAFQSIAPLTIGELWAWPTALKLALVAQLRLRAEGLATSRLERIRADELVDAPGGEPAIPVAWPATPHPAFVIRLLQRSREHGAAAGGLRQRLEGVLAAAEGTIEDAIRADGRHQAGEQAAMASLIGSLRLIATFDWREYFESVSLVEQVLQRDPAGVFGTMDFASRDRYRNAVEELAEPTGEGQVRVALRAVERARLMADDTPEARAAHVGYYLIGRGRRPFEVELEWAPGLRQRVRRRFFRYGTPGYLGTIAAGTMLLVGVALLYAYLQGLRDAWLVALALLALVPASELTIQVLQRIIGAFIPPRRLPRLDLDHVPPWASTMVIVPTMLDSVERARELVAHLEVQALGNLDPHIHFAILSDVRDADSETLPEDAVIVDAARLAVEALNARHAPDGNNRFFLFHRSRQWNAREGRWMGWERKRGKIEEFNRLLRGAVDTSFTVQVGDVAVLPEIRYCITLDSDTRLPRDTARQLVGIILHPLNQAVLDPVTRLVTDGYGILQPRVSVTFASAAGSLFARLYAGHTGVDPYTTAVSDTYQDLFGEGIFTGKGLYDVDAFMASLHDVVPENALLSHDLFEGLHARVALASDLELVDEYPSGVLTHARRQHRWIRGDWQLLFWLFPFVPSARGLVRNRLPLLARWKIFDNLRRSLIAPSLLALLVAGWLVLPGRPAIWTMAVLVVLASQLLPLLARLVTGPARAQALQVFWRNLRDDAAAALARASLSLTFLAYHAWEAVHAVVLTLIRLLVTRRRLLEWVTAASTAERTAGLSGTAAVRHVATHMAASPVIAAAIAIVVLSVRPSAFVLALPFLLLWTSAPAVAYWLSLAIGPRERPLSDHDRTVLRRTARKTWHYFETFVTEADGWLPPDNVQENGAGTTIARRTSPTNIGMSLLSTLAAHDLGYVTTDVLVARLDATLVSMDGLERHEGHFLNWYNTATLTPLHPRYVSTVDSGNLVASLIALAQGLEALADQPQTTAQRLRGLSDTAAVLADAASAAATTSVDLSVRARLGELARSVTAIADGADEVSTDDRARLSAIVQALAIVQEDLELVAPQDTVAGDLASWCRAVARGVQTLDGTTDVTPAALRDLAARAAALADAASFTFLYDRRRRIFSIGYRLADVDGPGRLDASFYDLLASEARLASFVAIASGDVPQHHWFHLGRLVTNVHGRATLVSWGGTMFEYLLPSVLMRSFPGTLLDQSCRASVRQQMDYGRRHDVPWGISESAYTLTDRAGNYQYKAFGVPGLGLKRGLADDLVVAPYATALAALVDPAAAADNFEHLALHGLEGRFGFYEAIDFRPRRTDLDADPAAAAGQGVVVRAFFAHHQGMSLLALTNVLHGDIFVTRFHADPRVQATELLLQERVPRGAILSGPRPEQPVTSAPWVPVLALRRFRSPHTSWPHTHYLSNGRYTSAITHAGGGHSGSQGMSVIRQREDRTSDAGGHFIYLRETWSGDVWSPTYLPTCRDPERYDVVMELDKVTFRRRDGDFETQLQVAVSPEDDVEVRRLSITNHGTRPREIEVTSYVELVLGRAEDDLAHPAFGKLFIETEHDAQSAGLLFSRRPRAASEAPVWAFHVLGVEGRLRGAVEWESDRSRFLGRGRTVANPVALDGRALSGTTGAVLDPVGALRERIRLPQGAFARVTFSTGVAPDRATALALVRKYSDGAAAARVFSMAHTHAHMTLQHLGISDDRAMLADRLASRVFGADASCARPSDLERNVFGQQNLWGFGISGDLPIVLVHVTEMAGLGLVRQVLLAQEYWRVKGLRADVVILNDHAADYLDEVQAALTALVGEPLWMVWRDKPGGMFLLRSDGMAEADRHLLGAVARVVLQDDIGSLAPQLERRSPRHPDDEYAVPVARLSPAPAADTPVSVPDLVMENGLGGFTPDGREYVVVLDGDRETPQPWSNVLANPDFGTVVTASGAAFTWAGNSRENRLTSFANDPLTDPTSEAIYLRDDESGVVWGATPGPLPRRADGGRWVVRHTAGATRYEHAVQGITQELTVAVATDDPVKLALLTLRNTSQSPRRISVFGYVEWALGPPRAGERRFVVTRHDDDTGALLATSTYNSEYRDHVAFWQATEPAASFTCDRTEFIGRHGTLASPSGLTRARLTGRTGAGFDPCAVLHVTVDLQPGETRRVAFVLGQASDAGRATALARDYASVETVAATIDAATRAWDSMLGTIHVSTPDDSFDLLVNRWLAYQSLGCRVWARCGPYQPGGAYGFRDQLQDVLSLVHLRPDLCREHLLRAASRQFVEGDVQHWWHPPSGRGTRTRCSDDLLWLPYALSGYIRRTGDDSVLDEVVPFLEAPLLGEHEDETYLQPTVSQESASVFEHALRAINRSLRYGAHGLPLIGSGDWNDGMNRVGHEGRGESVWLGWFLHVVLEEFARLCDGRGRGDVATQYRREARMLTTMLEYAWDGDWYRRAYFDDGTPLGSALNEECRLDSLTQSWAVISGAAQPRRAERAMESVRAQLVRRDAGLVLLLTPPFDKMAHDPGYIKGYVPGLRENGGQYTHAALWSLIALARLGRGDEAMELFHMINPINHMRTPDAVERYRTEPYALAADVYAHPMHVGRGGWTWYTGSAGWMYQAAIEEVLGLRRTATTFAVDPCIPAMWPAFSVRWTIGRTTYRINVTNPGHQGRGVRSATLDHASVNGLAIPLVDDGETHVVHVVLGAG